MRLPARASCDDYGHREKCSNRAGLRRNGDQKDKQQENGKGLIRLLICMPLVARDAYFLLGIIISDVRACPGCGKNSSTWIGFTGCAVQPRSGIP